MSARDEFGRQWFRVVKESPHPAMGDSISLPVDGGTDWLEIGIISAGFVNPDGSIDYAISPGAGVQWIDAVTPAQRPTP